MKRSDTVHIYRAIIYVKAPDAFGEESLLRFTITPVNNVPWGN